MDAPTVVEVTDSRVARPGARLYTTLEGENPSGSIKDRMVIAELDALMAAGTLAPGGRVSEVSAGSTARSLARRCGELGLQLDLFVPDTVPEEATAVLEDMGATVHRGSREEGYALYQQFCEEYPNHAFNQMFDHSLLRHYSPLGEAVSARAGTIDFAVGSVGTGHSLLGAAAGAGSSTRAVSAEPAEPEAILGIRNVELERFGPHDSCTPEMFQQRVVLGAAEREDFGRVETDQGEIEIGPSFALVLSAATRLLDDGLSGNVFLVGAENRR